MQPCHRAWSGGGGRGEGGGDAGGRLRGEGACWGREECETRDAAGHGLKPFTMGGEAESCGTRHHLRHAFALGLAEILLWEQGFVP